MDNPQSHRVEEPPGENREGLAVTFESDGNGKVIAAAQDSLRKCRVAITLQRWITEVERNRAAIRAYLMRELVRRLNSQPMRVGVFSKGKANGSGTMA